MGLISFSDIQNGDDADASVWNSRYGAILSQVNGNIDSTNLANGAVTAAKISSGVLQPNNFSNPYKFSVYASSSTALSANTWTKVQLNTELFDTNNNFDNSTNYRYVVPLTGFYQLNAQVGVGTSGITTLHGGGMELRKNGTALLTAPQQIGSSSGTALPRPSLGALVQLNAGDYLELFAICTEASRDIVAGANITYFTGYLQST